MRAHWLKHLGQRIRDWWIFREVDATDIDTAAVGEDVFLLIHSTRTFKRCINVRYDRDRLVELAEMLLDTVGDDMPKPRHTLTQENSE